MDIFQPNVDPNGNFHHNKKSWITRVRLQIDKKLQKTTDWKSRLGFQERCQLPTIILRAVLYCLMLIYCMPNLKKMCKGPFYVSVSQIFKWDWCLKYSYSSTERHMGMHTPQAVTETAMLQTFKTISLLAGSLVGKKQNKPANCILLLCALA